MREYPGKRVLLPCLAVVSVLLCFFLLQGALPSPGGDRALAAGETFTWTDTGGEVTDFSIFSLAWDGTGLYAGTHGHGLWRYDPVGKAWKEIKGELEGKSVRSLAWAGTCLYALSMDYQLWRYDPTPGTWTSIGMPPSSSLAVLAWDGTGLYAGGNGVWRYDPSTGEWTDTGWPLSSGGSYTAVTTLVWDGSSLYAGGIYNTLTSVGGTGILRYLPGYGWSHTGGPVVEDMQAAPVSGAWSGSRLYVGAYALSKFKMSPRGVWRYDPATGSWADTGGPVSDRLALSLGWDGHGLFVGAMTSSGTAVASVWYHDPSSGGWTHTGWENQGLLPDEPPFVPVAFCWDGSGRMYMGTMRLSTSSSPTYTGDGVWYCEVSRPAPTVTSVEPDHAVQFTAFRTVTVRGTGFAPGARVRLEREGETASEAFGVNVASDTEIACTFNLFGLEPGAYDLVVENPDGRKAVLEEGFTIDHICGAGSGAALLPLGIALGLLSGGTLWRRRSKGKG